MPNLLSLPIKKIFLEALQSEVRMKHGKIYHNTWKDKFIVANLIKWERQEWKMQPVMEHPFSEHLCKLTFRSKPPHPVQCSQLASLQHKWKVEFVFCFPFGVFFHIPWVISNSQHPKSGCRAKNLGNCVNWYKRQSKLSCHLEGPDS